MKIYNLAVATFMSSFILISCGSGNNSTNSNGVPYTSSEWLKGSNIANEYGIYGNKGQESSTNIPGARRDNVSWSGVDGNLYMFGGMGFGSTIGSNLNMMNDLWKYNVQTNMWTWISGSNQLAQKGIYGIRGQESVANYPGARTNSVSWTDSDGNMWLFGGYGYSASAYGELNDLWKYNPHNNMWMWVSGESGVRQKGLYGTKGEPSIGNVPGARYDGISWIDHSNNLWLFGGLGYDSQNKSGSLNDLWKFNSRTNEWTWVSGSNIVDEFGVYGTKYQASNSNIPGARFGSVAWVDNSNNLWLFGGNGYDSQNISGNLNDLWRFNSQTNQWTWVSGSDVIGESGVYGIKYQANNSNLPGARMDSIGWVDSSGNMWLFGGVYEKTRRERYTFNDLWKFNLNTNQWVWINGSNLTNQYGVYGLQGELSLLNNSGARSGGVSWYTNDGLWLFGGTGYAESSTGVLNDLWLYYK